MLGQPMNPGIIPLALQDIFTNPLIVESVRLVIQNSWVARAMQEGKGDSSACLRVRCVELRGARFVSGDLQRTSARFAGS